MYMYNFKLCIDILDTTVDFIGNYFKIYNVSAQSIMTSGINYQVCERDKNIMNERHLIVILLQFHT